MLGAYSRGVATGSLIAQWNPLLEGNDEQLREFARKVWEWMYQQGYAHIHPERECIDGFVWAFRMQQFCKTVPIARSQGVQA